MHSILNNSLLAGLISLGISLLVSPIIIKAATFLGIVDDPKKNKHPKVIHTYPTPRGGGIVVFIAVLIVTFIFLPLNKYLIGILTGATIIAIVGFLDDKYDLNPYLRIFLGFLAALAPIASGIGIPFISNPLGGIIDLSNPQITLDILGKTRHIWILSDLFGLFFLVFMMQMLNMGAKGVDGQLPGVVVISALTIIGISLKFFPDSNQFPVIILASITAGAYLGFLPWNFYPQKIMPGYGASTLAGYLLGVLSILSTTKVGTLLVVLGVPIIDTGYTMLRRILHKKSPVWGDRGHLHHRLLDLGFSKKQVALTYWGFTFVLGIVAINLNTISKVYTMVGIAVLVGCLILWLTYRPKPNH
ncbi:undecaprenyl/decaprenyl-phosphate alpha-N-acetylglucosaminyl 1-phosphate transferase [Candidatus Woesebacteria bacterium]|nr:undecaprenyl/decaprenyl-phosphate alpha-N-acetylglucosaminyl 1-phosphate transferase [Candidatus Woesebacteria bacterium]